MARRWTVSPFIQEMMCPSRCYWTGRADRTGPHMGAGMRCNRPSAFFFQSDSDGAVFGRCSMHPIDDGRLAMEGNRRITEAEAALIEVHQS